jgi:hypothetical protein
MKFAQLALSALVCTAMTLGLIGAAQAQDTLVPLGESRNHDPRLGVPWYETEGDWHGAWNPQRPTTYDGAYNGSWSMRSERASASLQISLVGNLAIIRRTQSGGLYNGQHCIYRGTFNATRDVVTGTYTCDWHHGAQPWRATIGVNVLPLNRDERPSLTTPALLLAFPWLETEGVWRGMWTPVDSEAADGRFTAHWAHERESARADLQISVTGGTSRTVTVHRTDPGGRTCTYVGQVSADFLTITGIYRCSDNMRNQLPWSAHVQLPQRR